MKKDTANAILRGVTSLPEARAGNGSALRNERPGPAGPLFGTWLRETGQLQSEAYGLDPATISTEEWLEYVRHQILAGFIELGEMAQALPWKPWAKDKRRPWYDERSDALGECVDLLHFVANVLYALNVSDEELSEAYAAKMLINRERMSRGGH